jgi:hypothetical protein
MFMEEILNKNIIKELGLDDLPEEEQEKTMLKIGEIIFKGVIVRVLQELSDKEAKEFEELISNKPDDQEAILNFLQKKVPNLDEITNEEVARFKQESLDFMNKLE